LTIELAENPISAATAPSIRPLLALFPASSDFLYARQVITNNIAISHR
jgi:hypothetical protein